MLPFDFQLPTRIYFGPGKINNIGKYLKPVGKKTLMVTGKSSMRKLGVLDKISGLLKKAGIETYTLINPVMPLITDVKLLIEKMAPYADTIWIYALNMENEDDRNWQNLKGILDRNFPDLVEKYKEIAFSSTHPHWAELRQDLVEFQKVHKVSLEIKV